MKNKIIYEPMTLVTDFILAVLAFYFGSQLMTLFWKEFNLIHFQMGWSLYWLALSAILGGISHGFGPHFSPLWLNIIRRTMLWSVGLSTVSLLLSTFSVIFTYRIYLTVRWIAVVLVVVYFIIIWRDSKFLNAVKFYVPVMLFILIVMVYLYATRGTIAAGYVSLAILISFIGVGVQISRFSIHPKFNHNDLYHVIQMAGLWFLYLGGMGLSDYL